MPNSGRGQALLWVCRGRAMRFCRQMNLHCIVHANRRPLLGTGFRAKPSLHAPLSFAHQSIPAPATVPAAAANEHVTCGTGTTTRSLRRGPDLQGKQPDCEGAASRRHTKRAGQAGSVQGVLGMEERQGCREAALGARLRHRSKSKPSSPSERWQFDAQTLARNDLNYLA